MHIQSLHYPLTESLRGHIEGRIHWALRWFARRAGLIRVVLKGQGGCKGAGDQYCSVTVHVKGEGDIRAEGVAGDAYKAISTAAKRLRRTLKNRRPGVRRKREKVLQQIQEGKGVNAEREQALDQGA